MAADVFEAKDFSNLTYWQSLAWHDAPRDQWRATVPSVDDCAQTAPPPAPSGVAGMCRNQWLALIGSTGWIASESPAGIRRITQRIKEREDVKDVEGVAQIIEIYQHTMAAHIHSKIETGVWGLTPISRMEATLEISSIGISIPLNNLYESAMLADEAGRSPERFGELGAV